MTTLKQIYREHGYHVNPDNEKGLGNLHLEEITKCWKAWLQQKLDSVTPWNFDYIEKETIKELLEDLEAQKKP